jgi:hypothetical protein
MGVNRRLPIFNELRPSFVGIDQQFPQSAAAISHIAVSGQSKDRGVPAQPNIDSPDSGSNTKTDLTENKPRFARMPLSGEPFGRPPVRPW